MNDHLFIGAVNVILIPQLVVESVLNLDISQVKIFSSRIQPELVSGLIFCDFAQKCFYKIQRIII